MDETLLLEDEREMLMRCEGLSLTLTIGEQQLLLARIATLRGKLAAAQRRVEKCAGLGIDEILKTQRELKAAKERERWILATAKLPDFGEWVLVIIGGVIQRMAAYLDGSETKDNVWWGWADKTADYAPLELVTHWRLLPAPPPEEAESK